MIGTAPPKTKAHVKPDTEVEIDLGPPEPPPLPPLPVSEPTLKRLAEVFQMLADRNRLKIVLALGQHGQMHVTDLCRLLDQSQPAVSHHLTLMRRVKLLDYERDGKHNYYFLNAEFVSALLGQVASEVGQEPLLEFDGYELTLCEPGD